MGLYTGSALNHQFPAARPTYSPVRCLACRQIVQTDDVAGTLAEWRYCSGCHKPIEDVGGAFGCADHDHAPICQACCATQQGEADYYAEVG